VKGAEDQVVTTDLSTLLTALYVKIDDWLGRSSRPGRPPRLSDAELLTLAVAQVLLGVRSEARWLRFVPAHLPGAFAGAQNALFHADVLLLCDSTAPLDVRGG
jgi:hypothetical protein